MRLMKHVAVLGVIAMACAAACGGSDDQGLDGGTDAGGDQSQGDVSQQDVTTRDTGADVVADTGSDAGSDVAEDAPSDVVSADAPTDSPVVDAPSDVIATDAGGCTSNSDCAPTDFCDKALGDCGGIGTCEAKPMFCSSIYFPVCACDKKTYANSCYANQAGESIAYTGTCE